MKVDKPLDLQLSLFSIVASFHWWLIENFIKISANIYDVVNIRSFIDSFIRVFRWFNKYIEYVSYVKCCTNISEMKMKSESGDSVV